MEAIILFLLIPITLLHIYNTIHIQKEILYIEDIIIRHDSIMRCSLNNILNEKTIDNI